LMLFVQLVLVNTVFIFGCTASHQIRQLDYYWTGTVFLGLFSF